MALPWLPPLRAPPSRSSTCTSTRSTPSWTARAGSGPGGEGQAARDAGGRADGSGSLAGVVELYREARGRGVKPLVGCEVYVADDRRAQTKGYAHLTLLAETNEGYANLIKLSSLGYLEGYYYTARRLGAAGAPREGHRCALGLPVRHSAKRSRKGVEGRP